MSDINELLARIGTQPRVLPRHAYLFGQTSASAPSVIASAANLKCAKLIIPGADAGIGMDPQKPNDPANGYDGCDAWTSLLQRKCVSKNRIIALHGCRVDGGYGAHQFNTFTEAQALIRWAKVNNVSDIMVVAPVFHLPRTIVSFATAAIAQDHPVWCWGHAVSVGSWEERTTHSQGVLSRAIREILSIELAKIDGLKRYSNLASLGNVLKYLDVRDRMSAMHGAV